MLNQSENKITHTHIWQHMGMNGQIFCAQETNQTSWNHEEREDLHLCNIYIMFFKRQDLWKASSHQFLMKYLQWEAHLHSEQLEIHHVSSSHLINSSVLQGYALLHRNREEISTWTWPEMTHEVHLNTDCVPSEHRHSSVFTSAITCTQMNKVHRNRSRWAFTKRTAWAAIIALCFFFLKKTVVL